MGFEQLCQQTYCNDEDINGYSDGGGHRQQSTKSGRGRNGKDDNNRQGRQQKRARTRTRARMTTARTEARTARMTGKDSVDDR
jgi:hypothetical protein